MTPRYPSFNSNATLSIGRIAQLAICLLVPAMLLAQPTLQPSDMGTVGSTFVYQQANYVTLSNSGPNQTWDFSNVVPTGALTFNWVDADDTQGGSNFPGATVAVSPVTLFQLDQYFTITATEMNDIGTYIPFILTTCSNPIKILKFPLTYGATWTDPFTCLRDDSGIIFYNVTGNLTATADGYGTVITPDGPISNVIRVSMTNTSTAVGGGVTTVTTITAQYYWKPGAGSYVAYNYIQNETVNGTPTGSASRLRYLGGNSIGLDELFGNSIGIDLAPNPADESALVTFSTKGNSTMEVFNDHGQVVQLLALGHKAPGIHQERIDTSSLPAGLYTVVIRSATGDQGVKRLMVQ